MSGGSSNYEGEEAGRCSVDNATFDRLVRSISRHVTRRTALGFISTVGLSVFATSALDASAKPCKGIKKKCGKKCIPKKDCCNDKECDRQVAGQVCKNGACKCPGGQRKCGDQCIANETCCTNGATGCPHSYVCDEGTCLNCIGDTCEFDEECCTNYCEPELGCLCWNGGSPCTSNRQCCSGTCQGDGKCACDPIGALCSPGFGCCSGNCVNHQCAA
jgi:hypothetical protein